MNSEKQNIQNGFTKASDYLAWKYQDLTLALVYGKIYRFCQIGSLNICNAKNETIAEELMVEEGTVRAKLEILVRDGYIIDHDPNLANRPHRRTLTTKLEEEEKAFWAFEAEYYKGKTERSFYDAFVEFATQNKIEPFLTIHNTPKKPRGMNGGRKKKVTNQPLISTNQPLITQKSTIDYDKSITRDFNRESTREIAFTFSEEFPLEDNESFGSEFPPEVGNSSPAPLGLFQNNSFDSTENKEINPLPSVYEIKVPGQSSSEVCREAVPIVDKTNPELLPETDFQKAFLNLFGIEFFPLSIYKETIQKLEKSLPSHSLKKILTLPFYEIGQAVYELDKFIGLNPEYFS